MSRTLAGVLVLVMAAGVAYAGIPDPDLSSCELGPDIGMTTCPAGDGPAFEYITVTAKRADTTPIEGIPYNSFFFTVTGGDVTMTHVDAETDANGEIRFTCVGDESIATPGVSIGAQIYTVVLNDSDDLDCKTFDLFVDANNWLNLQDFIEFSGDYGLVSPRSDYNWSGGVIGLQDFILFSAHYGHAAP